MCHPFMSQVNSLTFPHFLDLRFIQTIVIHVPPPVRVQAQSARARLIRDFKALARDPPGGVSGSPYPDNLFLWNAVIFGPRESRCLLCQACVVIVTPPSVFQTLTMRLSHFPDCLPEPNDVPSNLLPIPAETPFEDGTFRLLLSFEDSYPNRPPTVKFM